MLCLPPDEDDDCCDDGGEEDESAEDSQGNDTACKTVGISLADVSNTDIWR